MRMGRILGEGASFYHVMSRVVDRRFIFSDREKERFRDTMRRLERFSGVEVLTYALMSNHFHLLVHVPEPVAITDQDLGTRLTAIYSSCQVAEIMNRIDGFRAEGRDDLADAVKQGYVDRMFDLACFVKELKQRFTQHFNRRHKRRGTLWEERYKSVLIEGARHALLTVAAYIDLNPVRAGICADPAGYRFCGYGEALGGGRRARWGLRRIVSETVGNVRFERLLGLYRSYLVCEPGEGSGRTRAHASSRLSVAQIIRHRVRYFADGAVLGSQMFVDEVFASCRQRLGRKRRTGARSMRGADWQGLCVLRDLREDVFSG